MARIVIDANVIISASFGGVPFEAAARAMNRHQVYVSPEIERELLSVAARLGKAVPEGQRVVMKARIQELIAFAMSVSVSTRVVLSRHPKDDHYLSLCRQIDADFLITGDKDLLDISSDAFKQQGIRTRIINPRQFIEEVP
jgi:putative PIN family toxin of toxin-antitoxin system